MFVDIFSAGRLLHLIWLFAALIGVSEAIQQRELVEQGSSRTIEARPR
jgi:hypothetical protein